MHGGREPSLVVACIPFVTLEMRMPTPRFRQRMGIALFSTWVSYRRLFTARASSGLPSLTSRVTAAASRPSAAPGPSASQSPM